LIIKIPAKEILNVFVILFLSIFVLTSFATSVDIFFINFASAFSQDIINSKSNNPQQIIFNLKDWIDIGNSDSDTISTLQTDEGTIDFPDTSIIIAIDGNNNILNNDDTTSSTLLKLDFVGQVDLTGSSQIIFECSIDSAIFEVCNSPIIIDSLKPGEHSFEVRAIDQSGNVDETPAQFRWIVFNETTTSIDDDNDDATIDLLPPSTKITSVKDEQGTQLLDQGSTLSTSISFSVEGSDDFTAIEGLTFECSIDSAIFEVCNSPIIIDSLKPGEHSFEVRAIDQSGNVDETPAQFRWIVIDLVEKFENIKTIIEEGDISDILKNNLNVILMEIQTLVKDKSPKNDHEICSNLEEFMLQITHNSGDITLSNANTLNANIDAIFEKMQCKK
jgi:hypothetical protein